ncbi:DUF4350 domain-containing protein [Motiliproteus sediminis]|uniref:DUF4350 domain-containing protein n=1 Tax=Motiliproteus sediminis TaxID=1468178 RepID=UPI001AEFA3E5|nr:DUF4350 domain-containing protein [Motiliproteus sediminis]
MCRVALLFLVVLSPWASAAAVLFDQGHGQRFVIEREQALDLSQFAALWRSEGFDVRSASGRLTPTVLGSVDALVISGAFSDYSASELSTLYDFVEAGGTLVISLHVGPLNGALLSHFGIGVSNGVVLERRQRLNQNGSDFTVAAVARHPLTEQLDRIAVYGAWALNPGREATVLFATSDLAWMDLNRNRRFDQGEPEYPYAMAAVRPLGHGAVLVLGDDAVFQNRYLRDENQQLARNLVAWVKLRLAAAQ